MAERFGAVNGRQQSSAKAVAYERCEWEYREVTVLIFLELI